MSGYGFDQIALAAEKAAAEVKPAAIILSFTADDTRRNEMKRVLGAEKPYFEPVNGPARAAQQPGAALARRRRDARLLATGVRLVGAARHRAAPPGLAVRMGGRP